MRTYICIAFGLMLCLTTNLYAQSSTAESNSNASAEKMNFIKVNLTGLAFKNYSVQYERVINRKWSLAFAFRTMPTTHLPFKSQISKAVGTSNPETQTTIENMTLSNLAITPELRFYVGRHGYGRGFYIAPFYRFAKFKSSDITFTYKDNLNVSSRINLSGDITANTGGILFGIQRPLGKHLCLDLWLLGPHYGGGKGNFSGVSDKVLTPFEQDDLRQQLNDIDIPLTKKTVTVTATGANVNLDGPWGGIRSGISIGFRF